MVASLPLVVGTGTVAAALFYVALNLSRTDSIRSVLSVFFFAVAHFFLAASMFYAGEVVRATPTLGYLGGVFNTLLYVNILVAVIYVFLFIITYVKRSVLAAAGEEEFEVET